MINIELNIQFYIKTLKFLKWCISIDISSVIIFFSFFAIFTFA